MKKNYMFMMIFFISILLMGCSNTELIEENKRVLEELKVLKASVDEVDVLRTSLVDLEENYAALEKKNIYFESAHNRLADRVKVLESELEVLSNQAITYNYQEDLIDVTLMELDHYKAFKENYDVEALRGLSPLSVCKLYLYSNYVDDYESEFEFYTTLENYTMWTKEEHLNFPEQDRKMAYDVFRQVYNLEVEYFYDEESGEVESAGIRWNTHNGYVDEEYGSWVYTFSMVIEDGIWRVTFLPMQ